MTTPPNNPIPGLFQRAMVAHNTGKPDVAQKLYARILAINPHLPEVHYQLGRLEMGLSHPQQALQHLKTARTLKPDEPVIWTTMMDALVALGNDNAIARLMRDATSAGLPRALLGELLNKSRSQNKSGIAWIGDTDPADFQATVKLFETGRFDEAEAAAAALHASNPKVAPVLAVLAASQASLGKKDLAAANYEKIVTLDPNYVEGRLQYGQLLMQTDQGDKAREHLEKAFELAPKAPLVNKFLGMLNQQDERAKEAIAQLTTAREQLPDDVQLLTSLAAAFRSDGNPAAVKSTIEHALSVGPPMPELYWQLGNALAELDQNEAAITAYGKALELEPGSVPVLTSLASLYQLIGDFEQTQRISERVFAAGVAHGGLFSHYTSSRKIEAGDPVIAQMEQAFIEGREVEGTRVPLAFALAKCHEDTGAYAKVFAYLRQGNDALKAEHPIVPGSFWSSAQLQHRIHDRGIKPAADAGPLGHPHPIFVTGMPRSGTTLTEQIISSHSQVAALGELEVINERLGHLLELTDAGNAAVSGDDLRKSGEAMRKTYSRLAPGAEFVTDKAIGTFQYIGLLQQALPDAKIIVVRRDPRDNCLSMYKNYFMPGTHRYTTDLEALARFYLDYLDTLDYWRTRCPGSFCEIRYEELIANPEEQARKLIDACGLAWEERCLEFYNNARTVRTLSTYQVRQPIYSSSVGAWKNYEDELQPLIKILGDGGALD